MPPGTRRRRRGLPSTTIHDVAQAAGVSTATVSRVVSGNYPVAAGTRERVMAAIESLDYAVNAHARSLSAAAKGPIAVLLGDITGPSFAALASGVEREARARGQLCLVGTTEGDPERELALIELLRQQQAAAVILPGGVWDVAEYDEQIVRYARSLQAVGGRVVLCGRPTLSDPDSGAISIHYDNEAGAAAVAQVPLQAGHRRFLLLPGADGLSTAEERLRGFRRALSKSGIADEAVMVRRIGFYRDQARDTVLEALGEDSVTTEAPLPFTAILCGSDVMATGALEALRSRGLRCPEDVSVTGYDDIPGAQDTNPALTTVHVPYEEMGVLAVQLALDAGEDVAVPEVMRTHVVVRESVAPPAPRS